MTGAVEKVAAAIETAIDRIEQRKAIRFNGLYDAEVRELAEAAITALREDGWASPVEVQRLRDEISARHQRLLDADRIAREQWNRINDQLTAAMQREQAAEARNAAALALHAGMPGLMLGKISGGIESYSYCAHCLQPWPCMTVKALGGETATTQGTAQPTCRQCGSPTVPGERSLCSDCWIRQGENETEMAHAPAVAAVEPRSGGERGNGRVADSDTAESHTDLPTFRDLARQLDTLKRQAYAERGQTRPQWVASSKTIRAIAKTAGMKPPGEDDDPIGDDCQLMGAPIRIDETAVGIQLEDLAEQEHEAHLRALGVNYDEWKAWIRGIQAGVRGDSEAGGDETGNEEAG